ncbi:MAG: hypothetical protein HDR84_00305 [Bacteroides sp.]|nr:hypothetical protein [Bacteroides sp.]
MRKISLIIFLLALLPVADMYSSTNGRRKGYTLKTDKKTDVSSNDDMVKGSFMVASQCEDCNHGYRLDEVKFSGFDKPRNSKYETFFITNNTDRILTGVNLYIEYQTTDGQMLHKRFYPLRCNIPPGETRNVQLNSWDTQHSFVFEKSATSSKSNATPFKVIFDPVAFYLRF